MTNKEREMDKAKPINVRTVPWNALDHWPNLGGHLPHRGRTDYQSYGGRMSAKTDAERQKASRGARAAAGLKRIDVWCRPEDEAAIREFAAKLQRKRVKHNHSQAPHD